MSSLEAALRQICQAITETRHAFALVGGLAVSARTEPRFTRDVDIAITVSDDADAETLIRSLQAAGFLLDAVVEQEATGRLATARLTRSSEPAGPVVDLLFSSSGIEPEIVSGAEDLELLPAWHTRVATTGHLIALKVLARDDVARPQDIGDLRALLRVASVADVAEARAALGLITDRGYDRGRDLRAELKKVLP